MGLSFVHVYFCLFLFTPGKAKFTFEYLIWVICNRYRKRQNEEKRDEETPLTGPTNQNGVRNAESHCDSSQTKTSPVHVSIYYIIQRFS